MDKKQHNHKLGLETQDNVVNKSETSLWCVPKIGRRQTCYFYKPAGKCVKDNTIVFEVCLSSIFDENKSACYFGSALCAFCPDLMPVVIDALEDNGIEVKVTNLFDAAKFGVNLENTTFNYDPIKIYTIVGLCLIVLFMNNVNAISDEFMKNTGYALAKKLRMPEDKISDFGVEIPPAQAKVIYNVLGTHDALKKEVEEFLTWLSKRNGKMASFVLEWKNKFD